MYRSTLFMIGLAVAGGLGSTTATAAPVASEVCTLNTATRVYAAGEKEFRKDMLHLNKWLERNTDIAVSAFTGRGPSAFLIDGKAEQVTVDLEFDHCGPDAKAGTFPEGFLGLAPNSKTCEQVGCVDDFPGLEGMPNGTKLTL